MKRYHYHFVDLGVTIEADSGREAEELYASQYEIPYEGVIELLDTLTGETNTLMPVKF